MHARESEVLVTYLERSELTMGRAECLLDRHRVCDGADRIEGNASYRLVMRNEAGNLNALEARKILYNTKQQTYLCPSVPYTKNTKQST